MHELSIAQSILATVRDEAQRNNWGPVASVRVRIGELAGVHADSLRFGFEALRSEFDLARCALHIEHVPVTLSCATCGAEAPSGSNTFECSRCGSSDVTVIEGYDLDIVSLDVLDAPNPSNTPVDHA